VSKLGSASQETAICRRNAIFGTPHAQDAVSAADHDMKVIYKKWRDAGKI
jgi:hypothetical protein